METPYYTHIYVGFTSGRSNPLYAGGMTRARVWHEIAITLGGPIAMSIMSLALARIIEEGAGPVIPPLTEPGNGSMQESVSSLGASQARQLGVSRNAVK